jgi:hypothetical protein
MWVWIIVESTVRVAFQAPAFIRPYAFTYLRTELNSSWETANCTATQELPSILWNTNVHYRVHWSLSWARLIQSIPPHPISLRSILILSTHLRLGLPSGLFHSGFSLNNNNNNNNNKYEVTSLFKYHVMKTHKEVTLHAFFNLTLNELDNCHAPAASSQRAETTDSVNRESSFPP